MLSISFEIVASIALVTSLLVLLISYFQTSKLRSRLQYSEQTLSALRDDISALCSGTVGLGEHLTQLEQRALQLTQRQEKVEMQGPSSQNYRHARKLVGKGADLEEVIADCGLARGEAELVAFAHRIKKAS